MFRRKSSGLLAIVSASICYGSSAIAAGEPAADFSGRSINIIVGLAAGGGYDTYARFLARHYPKHLPGSPQIVVQNMPGAGGMRAASYIFNVAPKDGTAIGTFGPTAAIEPLLGNPQANFETAKFTWIGNMHKDVLSCGVWRSSGLSSWSDVESKGARFGGTGLFASTTQHALLLRNLLGINAQVVHGYGGTKEVNLAMQRGEVDATCGMFLSTIRGPYAQYIKSGDLKIVVQFGKNREPEFGNAANIYDLVKTDAERRIVDFVFLPSSISRPYAAPPGVPAAIAKALRNGFVSTLEDPAVIADAKKLGLELDFQSGSEVAEAFANIAETPPGIISKAKLAITKR